MFGFVGAGPAVPAGGRARPAVPQPAQRPAAQAAIAALRHVRIPAAVLETAEGPAAVIP
ncbi:hypothetical protein ACIGXI_36235 [Kitasatospora aureofaciens]|uniref:hypothetical protein n=1 Tax=Kitasatospora aureofaciens TaxID=1894 RepID=UPI0037CA226A